MVTQHKKIIGNKRGSGSHCSWRKIIQNNFVATLIFNYEFIKIDIAPTALKRLSWKWNKVSTQDKKGNIKLKSGGKKRNHSRLGTVLGCRSTKKNQETTKIVDDLQGRWRDSVSVPLQRFPSASCQPLPICSNFYPSRSIVAHKLDLWQVFLYPPN